MKTIPYPVHVLPHHLERYTLIAEVGGRVLKRYKTIEGLLKHLNLSDEQELDIKRYLFEVWLSGGTRAVLLDNQQIVVHMSHIRTLAHNHAWGHIPDDIAIDRDILNTILTLKESLKESAS